MQAKTDVIASDIGLVFSFPGDTPPRPIEGQGFHPSRSGVPARLRHAALTSVVPRYQDAHILISPNNDTSTGCATVCPTAVETMYRNSRASTSLSFASGVSTRCAQAAQTFPTAGRTTPIPANLRALPHFQSDYITDIHPHPEER